MCMSEYLDRELVAVPRLPLLSECAPLAAAVAATRTTSTTATMTFNHCVAASRTTSSGGAENARRSPTIPRYSDTASTGFSSGRRPTWRMVRLRLGRSAGRPVEVEDQDHQSHETMASRGNSAWPTLLRWANAYGGCSSYEIMALLHEVTHKCSRVMLYGRVQIKFCCCPVEVKDQDHHRRRQYSSV